MGIKEYALKTVKSTALGRRYIKDRRYRIIFKATVGLIFNFIFAFYNGILGALSSSYIFAASCIYYLLLSLMRFSAVISRNGRDPENERQTVTAMGIMLIVLSVVFHIMVIVSMKHRTMARYGTITMIAIATFTFTKITAAAVTAIKHKKDASRLIKAINAIRYSEVAVSLLTMQQSMLVSFGEGGDSNDVILNACTGAAVCFFIMALGIITLKSARRKQ